MVYLAEASWKTLFYFRAYKGMSPEMPAVLFITLQRILKQPKPRDHSR